MSGDPESDYFADGMAEEIITALSRCSGMLVIARNSSFTYKGRAVDVRQVGRELGVGYVLEGSVRRSEDRLRITAQLIEATAGTHLWADRFDGSLGDVFELQDRIAETAAADHRAEAAVCRAGEGTPQAPAEPGCLRAVVARAVPCSASSPGRAWLRLCIAWMRAIEIEPTYAPAMASLAYYHAHCHFQGWGDQPDCQRDRAIQLAGTPWIWPEPMPMCFGSRRSPYGHSSGTGCGRWSSSVAPCISIRTRPSHWAWRDGSRRPTAIRWKAANSWRGRSVLSPRYPRGWFVSTGMAIACLADSKFKEAVTWAEKALAENPRFGVALRVLAVALANSDQLDRARQVVKEVLRLEPHLTLSGLRTRIPMQNTPILNLYRELLKKAGLPE